MKPELLEKLLDAGFTKEEIFSLAAPEGGVTNGAETESHVEPETGNEAESDAAENANGEPETGPEAESSNHAGNAFEARLSGIEKGLSDLMKTIQANNLRSDSFNQPPSESLENATDKIMASIIRPEKMKG